MADILIDVEVRGQSSVTSAVKGISTLQNNVKLLSNAFKSGGLSQRQYYKGIKQLADASSKSEQELRKYANTVRAEEKETKKAAASAKAYAIARKQALEMDRRLTAEKLKSANAARMQASEEERLKSKFVQGHTAMNIYSKELNDLSIARKMDIISAEEQQRAVQELNVAMKSGTGVFTDYGNGLGVGTKKQSKFGVVAQQTGYQVGDFLVQIQSGANPMMAFGQQATQLVGVMGMFGKRMMFAGAALGVIIPLATALAGAWLRSKASSEEATRSLDSYVGSLDSAIEAFEDLEKAVTSSLESIDKSLKASRLGVSKEELSFIDKLTLAQDKYNTSLENLNSEREFLLKGEFSAKEMEELLLSDTEAMKRAREEASLASAAYEKFKALRTSLLAGASLDAFGGEGDPAFSPEGLARAAEFEKTVSRIRGIMGEVSSEATTLTQYAADVASELGLGYEEALKLQEEMEKAEGYALGITKLDMEAGIIAAAAAAAVLAENMGISLGLALELVAIAGKSKAENAFNAGIRTGSMPPQAAGDFNRETGNKPNTFLQSYLDRVDQRVADRKSAARSSSGGGGGSKTDPRIAAQKAVDSLISSYDKEYAVLIKIKNAQADVDKAMQLGLITANHGVEIMDAYTKSLEDAKSPMLDLANTAAGAFSDSFMSIVDGTKSVKDAFADMVKVVIKKAFEMAVINPIINAIFGGIGGFTKLPAFGSTQADGGAWSGGRQIQAYADGGVVGGPTMFPMSGGKTGLMGEAGPEAIMPLKRGKNGKLGVETSGSGSVVVNNNFNIAANGDESVKRIIQGEMPKISEATKRAVVDSKRRGGSYGRSF